MKIKNTILILIFIPILGISSCSDYLSVDRYFKDRQSMERIFSSRDYSEEWLANAYFYLLSHNLEMGHRRFNLSNLSSDDVVFNEGGDYAKMKAGEYGPGWLWEAWWQSYRGIRQASIFLHHIEKNPEFTKEEITDLKGQARFLRAYFYWLLVRRYGPVPILPDEGLDYDESYDNISLPRNTMEECTEYISNEMIQAAKDLPIDRDRRSAARPTKGAALAVRAKIYLYLASPLYNGNKEMADFIDDKGQCVIPQEYDETRWAKAAAASLDVIKLGKYKLYTATRRVTSLSTAYPATIEPPYHPIHSESNFPLGWADLDPFESYRSVFNGELYAIENPELIFTRGDNQLDQEYGITALVIHQMPQYAGGFNCHGISGKQCDAYAMNDGTPFNRETSLKGFVTKEEAEQEVYPHLREGVWKEYANREPRFYASVAFNGALWPFASAREEKYRDKQIWYYRGEVEGRVASNERWQPTGIGRMKFINPKDTRGDNHDGKVYPKVDTAIRYADILLMYTEALNELTTTYQIESWDTQTTYTISRDIEEMRKGISQVRIRGGIPDLNQETYEDQEALRKAVKHERQIELFCENQRYYDLRRWKDAPKEEGEPVYGCNTQMTIENRELFHQQVEVPHIRTVFSKRMYFWPIDFDELKRNKRLTQAPGWQEFD